MELMFSLLPSPPVGLLQRTVWDKQKLDRCKKLSLHFRCIYAKTASAWNYNGIPANSDKGPGKDASPTEYID